MLQLVNINPSTPSTLATDVTLQKIFLTVFKAPVRDLYDCNCTSDIRGVWCLCFIIVMFGCWRLRIKQKEQTRKGKLFVESSSFHTLSVKGQPLTHVNGSLLQTA